MPADDYSSAVGGGLKLKGGKPKGVTKKKKKDKPKTAKIDGEEGMRNDEDKVLTRTTGAVGEDVDEAELARMEEEAYAPGDGKTEAERKHEETKRKRLNERLLKTGAKTHKQRVEELNKYLSTLSEHHDMPKIGPG